ncbi:uncharacterized protein LOC135125645 [Zophobas morio]|uniref:uncharacterized protein LOC135125645 n=1 Tax=Zophobas morio TaxID=2755281 RepID=UPI0030834EE5
MKQIIFLTVLFAGAFCSRVNQDIIETSIDPYVFEDIINSTIEGYRPDIPDPLLIDTYEISLPAEEDAVIVGNGTISNLDLAGLQGFQVSALNFAIIGMTLNFTIDLPVLDLFTDFDLDLLIADTLAIWGVGNITVHLDGLSIDGSGQANLTGGIQVENLRLTVSLQNATFDIHGLLDDEDLSELLSDILNDLAVNLIDENQELISEVISPIAETLINEILASMSATTTVAPETTPVGIK